MLSIDGRRVARLEVAGSRRARTRGLVGRRRLDGALWLPGVRSVHTVGVRFPIDVAWIDEAGRVQHVTTVRPGRVSRWRRAAGILEAEAGSFAEWALIPGSRLGGLGSGVGHRSVTLEP